jgi:hypothetical protein
MRALMSTMLKLFKLLLKSYFLFAIANAFFCLRLN